MPAVSVPGRSQTYHPGRSGKRGGLSVLVVVVLLCVVGLCMYLGAGGAIPIPFSDPPRVFTLTDTRTADAAGTVRVPISGRNVPAYTRITRDDLTDPATQQLAFVKMDSNLVADAMVVDVSKIIGRVLAHEKSSGYVFTEADFLPKGTRPGTVGGIPPGKRARRVEVNRIDGLFGLRPGDRFDLVATLPVDEKSVRGLDALGGAYGDQLQWMSGFRNLMKQASVRVIVQNGTVVSPVEQRAVPVASSSLTRGLVTRTRPVQEMVIAIDPREVALLTEALAVGANVECFFRSGHPSDPFDSITPELEPVSPFIGPGGSTAPRGSGGLRGASDMEGGADGSFLFVETINGGSDGSRRALVPVPLSGSKGDT